MTPNRTSAYLELERSGEVGELTYAMLLDVAGRVVHSGNYPSPSGAEHWTEPDVQELVHDFLTGPRGLQRVITMFNRATDEHSLRNVAVTSIRNHLADEARSSDRGHLRQRLEDVVEDWDGVDFRDSPAGKVCGRPNEAVAAPWSGDLRDLIDAAAQVEGIEIIRWRKAARRSPIAERDSLGRIIDAVLEAAGRPVLLDDLADVMEAQFALAATPLVIELDDEPYLEPPSSERTDDVALDATVAERILDQLSAAERTLLAHFDDGVRELGVILGVGKSKASDLRNDLGDKLKVLLTSQDATPETFQALRTIAQEWTARVGSSSHDSAPPS